MEDIEHPDGTSPLDEFPSDKDSEQKNELKEVIPGEESSTSPAKPELQAEVTSAGDVSKVDVKIDTEIQSDTSGQLLSQNPEVSTNGQLLSQNPEVSTSSPVVPYVHDLVNVPGNNPIMQEANDEIAKLLLDKRITAHESSKLQSVLRENASLKEKLSKLKLLLSRSSKVSKEAKQDLEQHKRLLDAAKKEVERLNGRIETLASRPTHMDLLADFETNFDRALMNLHADKATSVVEIVRQSEGQATEQYKDEENVYDMLMMELSQSKARVEHMENMNSALKKRSTQLEKQNEKLRQERESVNLKMSNLQLELKMAKMETEYALRSVKEKESSLIEMQMELDLVTKSAINANARAAEGMEVAESAKTDKAQLQELEAKVAALQEWAIASTKAKEAILEENKMLERKLKEYENMNDGITDGDDDEHKNVIGSENGTVKIVERRLWNKTSSLVIGAGSVESRIIELGDVKLMDWETVILRWKFDIKPQDQDIHFSIVRGRVDMKKYREADFVTKDRVVVSGGAGEVDGAFTIQNACTLVWSNEHSWVRPRAIKYSVEAYAIM